MRGIFAVSIVLYHCKQHFFMYLTGSGLVGFFIMSGFLLCMLHPVNEHFSHSKFVAERALRIYPMHWLALLLLLMLWYFFGETYKCNWPSLIPNVLLVQSFIPDKACFLSFNGVAWFLCDLLLCYVCYPYFVRWFNRIRLRWLLLLFAVLFVAYCILVWPLDAGDDEPILAYFHVFPPFRLYEFAMGIVVYRVWSELKGLSWTETQIIVIELIAYGAYALLIAVAYSFPHVFTGNYHDNVMWEIPMAFVVLVVAMNAGREGLVGRLLCCAPLQWLGRHSMEIFLFQAIAGGIYNYLVCPLFGHFGILVYEYYAWGIFVVLLPLSWGIHRYVSVPLYAWAKKKTQ